jgi:acyl-homoserine lactone acylase PvdQ
MQMSRLAAQGRISEFFGAKALNLDKFMLAMEFYELSKESVQFLDESE